MPEKDNIFSYGLDVRPISQFTEPAEPTDSPESRLNAFNARKAKERYEQAYKEYEDAHPVGTLDWIGYDSRETGLTNHPYAMQASAAHRYALEKTAADLKEKNLISGWFPTYLHNPEDPIENWKEGEKLQTSIATSVATLPLLISASAGSFGTIPALAANLKFGYDGFKSLISPEGFQKTVNFFKDGRYGRAALSGFGDAFDIGLAVGGLRSIGNVVKPYAKSVLDAYKFNRMNLGTGFRMDYPWQIKSNQLPLGTIDIKRPYVAPNSWQINKRIYQSPVASQLEIVPQAAYTSDFSGLEFPELTMYHFGLDGQRAIDPPKFRGILGGGGYDPKFNNWFNQTAQYKLSQNEVRHSNLEKLLKKFNGNEQAMWNWLNKNK